MWCRWSLVNVVDADTRELVSSWILHTTVASPVIMRSYDVDMLIGQHTNKKIAFKNPWDVARKFSLESSDETVMSIRYVCDHYSTTLLDDVFCVCNFLGRVKLKSLGMVRPI